MARLLVHCGLKLQPVMQCWHPQCHHVQMVCSASCSQAACCAAKPEAACFTLVWSETELCRALLSLSASPTPYPGQLMSDMLKRCTSGGHPMLLPPGKPCWPLPTQLRGRAAPGQLCRQGQSSAATQQRHAGHCAGSGLQRHDSDWSPELWRNCGCAARRGGPAAHF